MKYEYSAAFLVLLYGKTVFDSETLNSIKTLSINNEKALLVIWNNGPKSIKNNNIDDLKKLGFDVVIRETLDNQSLAKIYNQFIDEFDCEKYVVLDDDSWLNQEYFDQVFSLYENAVGVPLIYCDTKLAGPKLNRKLCNIDSKITDKDRFFAIGSGLAIGNKIVKEMKAILGQVFDERFYFYGVDSTFFFRLKMCKLREQIKIISGFEHSLSCRKKESDTVTEFRLKEMSYDIGLRLRYYKPLYSALFQVFRDAISSAIKKVLHKRRKVAAGDLLKAYFSGKHYRI